MSAFLDRPRSVFLRRALFQVHLWVGVLAGLYVIVVCVTGAALVFRINMQRAVHPDLLTSSGDGPPANIATVLERLDLPDYLRAVPKGAVELRGRNEALELWSIERSD